MVFSVQSENVRWYFKLCHDHFLSHHFNVLFINRLIIERYIVCVTGHVVNKCVKYHEM
jgi:hypothetical protein